MDYYTPTTKDLINAGRRLERADILALVKQLYPAPTKQTLGIIQALASKGKF
jgi:hypothetical protein